MSDSEPDSGAGPVVFDAVVLAGGRARRLGGADKPGLRVGGRRLLDRVLSASAAARETVVVAEPRATSRPVRWAREEPAGGGPVAALEAGVRALAAQPSAPYVLVLSADLPFLDGESVERLLSALLTEQAPAQAPTRQPMAAQAQAHAATKAPAQVPDRASTPPGEGTVPAPAADPSDGVMFVDADGRDQPLVAVYRGAALRRRLAVLRDEYGGLEGLPLRRLTEGLRLGRIADRPEAAASFDCDTWADLAAARARIREHGQVLDEWISAVKDELGVELDVDTGVLLDLARDAAHSVARPAAPLTTFLVGYAVGQAKGGPQAVAEAARKAAELALRWNEEEPPTASADSARSAGPASSDSATDSAADSATGPTSADPADEA
ncbi:molybdenum cofactor guanylyltransferase [Streptomyces sp. NA04227]|uniref:DUF6457 domain-containing protein n=1 Tax=Streptomyces sp. NA04227 TaxID=2742136 RepID=UPI0015922554|nr:DUF6457 domain-containing protein [Streptomyces sp. NA04227]QKW07712.1 molybdenum cofactor guanylyltransferase [Streptomyces sp. NA04227]